MGQLYGRFDPVSHEWTDGKYFIMIRLFKTPQKGWKGNGKFSTPVKGFFCCFLAHQKRLSMCFTGDNNSYLTHVISPKSCVFNALVVREVMRIGHQVMLVFQTVTSRKWQNDATTLFFGC